jgi:5'(3')-deoxyribonucleotidase
VTLFLDMDGVLADFDAGVLAVLGMNAVQYTAAHGTGAFWQDLISKAPHLYADLPMVPHAVDLYSALCAYNPVILTGAHFRSNPCKIAEVDKRQWLAENFPGTNSAQSMIACRSMDKCRYIRHPGDVLVDDRLKYASLWVAAGGTFIHYADPENWRSTVLEVQRWL